MYELVRSDDAGGLRGRSRSPPHHPARFTYNSGTSTLLARMVGDAVGNDAGDTRAFLDDELFEQDRDGPGARRSSTRPAPGSAPSRPTRPHATSPSSASSTSAGRVGRRRILDEDWVERTRTPSPANPEYGAQWWLDPQRPGVFYAIGIRGQVITVDPAHDL